MTETVEKEVKKPTVPKALREIYDDVKMIKGEIIDLRHYIVKLDDLFYEFMNKKTNINKFLEEKREERKALEKEEKKKAKEALKETKERKLELNQKITELSTVEYRPDPGAPQMKKKRGRPRKNECASKE